MTRMTTAKSWRTQPLRLLPLLLCASGCEHTPQAASPRVDAGQLGDASEGAGPDASEHDAAGQPEDGAAEHGDGGPDADAPEPTVVCTGPTLNLSAKERPVNVLWVTATAYLGAPHPSIVERRKRLGEHFDAFEDEVRTALPGYRSVLLSRRLEDWLPSSTRLGASDFLYLETEVPDSELLQKVAERVADYQPFLSDDAILHVIALTPVDSSYRGETPEARVNWFLSDMETLLAELDDARDLRIHAVVSPGDADEMGCVVVENCCDGAHDDDLACKLSSRGAPPLTEVGPPMKSCYDNQTFDARVEGTGPTYLAGADLTGGVSANICGDFASLLDPIADNVIASKHGCHYVLPESASNEVPESLRVKSAQSKQTYQAVSGSLACGDGKTFYLTAQDDEKHLVLCGAACAEAADQGITLELDCSQP